MSQNKYTTKYISAKKPNTENLEDSPRARKFMHIPINETSCYFPTLKGNITIEAAMVTPFLIGLLLVLLFLFRLLQIEAGVQEALIYSARRVATLSSVTRDNTALLAESEAIFRKSLQEIAIPSKYIRSGTSGISLLESNFDEDYITICAKYEFRLPGLGIEKVSLPIIQSGISRKWVGEEYTNSDYVYVTMNGEVYHKNTNCSSIKVSVESVEMGKIGGMRNTDREKYSACSFCAEKNTDAKWVYITSYGSAYHTDLGCIGLRRNLQRIPFKDIGERRACKICWE